MALMRSSGRWSSGPFNVIVGPGVPPWPVLCARPPGHPHAGPPCLEKGLCDASPPPFPTLGEARNIQVASGQMPPVKGLNDEVRAYWEEEVCGTGIAIVGDLNPMSREWFERIEAYRYLREPYIHGAAQFTRWRSKQVLEIGVGAGTDHLQFARAGADLTGVDLTDAAVELCCRHLGVYGFESRLMRLDAEELPFESHSFDLVYSWGVIHHSARPAQIVAEVARVLRPGGTFVGMFYNRRSLLALRLWVGNALRARRPWLSFADVVTAKMESVGTKAYTEPELADLFSAFSTVEVRSLVTPYDVEGLHGWVGKFLPPCFGWNTVVRAVR